MGNKQPCYLFSQIFYLLVFSITYSQQMTNSGSGSSLTEGSSYFFYQRSEYPRDCQEILSQCSSTNSVTSGVFLIKPDGYPEPFEVFCDNNMQSGGWTVIQRRVDGSVDFNRGWVELREGFGFLSSEFWLGHRKISFLTNQKKYELQINMVNDAGSSFYMRYDLFRISDEWGEFKLAGLGDYSGNASSVTTYCPSNMLYDSCSCEASCSDTSGCTKNCNDGEETCICPNGFLLDHDSNCVTEQECRCYETEFGLIMDGDFQVSSDCSRNCSCNNNQLSCVNIQCSADATCQEIGGVYQCQCDDGFDGDGIMCTRTATTMPSATTDCSNLNNGNAVNGVYTINPTGMSGSEFQVFCDMTTDGGGWTVFQRRVGGTQSFYQDWDSYKAGFGVTSGDHWLGNDKLHAMTNQKDYQLRIDFVDSGGSPLNAVYSLFRINDENDNYRITSLGSYSGNAGNYLRGNHPFSTYDRDNDYSSTYNCAERHQSGWWYYINPDYTSDRARYCHRWFADSFYRFCTGSNLNGNYTGGDGENIFWYIDIYCNIQQTEMKIRPI